MDVRMAQSTIAMMNTVVMEYNRPASVKTIAIGTNATFRNQHQNVWSMQPAYGGGVMRENIGWHKFSKVFATILL